MADVPKTDTRDPHYFRFLTLDHWGSVAVCPLADGSAEVHVRLDGWAPALPDRRVHIESSSDPDRAARQAVLQAVGSEVRVRLINDDLNERTPRAFAFPQADGLRAGEYHSRIWRPCSRYFLRQSQDFRTDSATALSLLDGIAREIFKVIEPAENLERFGHMTRELLVLAAAETEDAWRAILSANGVTPEKPTTKDYVRLLRVMRLDKVTLKLRGYQGVRPFSPFAGWDAEKPTKSLAWYQAYRNAKHSRTERFSTATLQVALDALAAAWAVHAMQFGPETVDLDSDVFGLKRGEQFAPAEGYITAVGTRTGKNVSVFDVREVSHAQTGR